MTTIALDARPPALPVLLREAMGMASWPVRMARAPAVPRGKGAPVLVIPGFLASDRSTAHLRAGIAASGYRAYGWKGGMNWGVRVDTLDRLEARLVRITDRAGAPAALVGWSLGGLFARELAKRVPERVRMVATLGTPFSGDPRANHAWHLYEFIARHPVDAPPITARLPEKPPVPTLAFWSGRDGIIAPACARGQDGERDEAVELGCTHLGFATDPGAICTIVARLG